MRPLFLSIEGLRSFRAPVEIDFEDRGQLAVIGDTGAGKSSILEAMTYALYGRTTFSGHANRELINDTSSQMRVVLRFRVSGEEWEVARTLRRGKGDKVQPAGVQLKRTRPDGDAHESARAVNEQIKKLLGLDSEAFLRTVVLPQGRFARLLVEDNPSERGKILRQVWPMDELDQVAELVKEALEPVGALHARIEQAAEGHPDDPAAHLAELRRAQGEAEQSMKEAEAVENDAKVGRAKLDAAEKLLRAVTSVSEQMDLEEIDGLAEQVAPLVEAEAKIEEEEARLDARRTEARSALDKLAADDGPGRADVTTALGALSRIEELAAKVTKRAADWRSRESAAKDLRLSAVRAKEAGREAEKSAAAHKQQRDGLAAGVERARKRCEEVQRGHRDADQRRADEDAARRRLSKAETRKAEGAERREKAVAFQAGAAKAAKKANEELAEARRANAAAEAAHGLHAGEDCPVCARELPADWSAPQAGSLDAARDCAHETGRAEQAAQAELVRCEAQLEEAVVRVAEMQADADKAGKSFRDALTELAKAADAAVTALPPLDELLKPLKAAEEEAAAALAAHEQKQTALDGEAHRLATVAAKAVAEADGGEVQARDARQVAEDALAELAKTVEGISKPFRPVLDLPDVVADLTAVDTSPAAWSIAAAQERERALTALDKQRARCHDEMAQVDQAKKALERRRENEVAAPLGRIVGDLNRWRDLLGRQVSVLENAGAQFQETDQVPTAPPSGPSQAVHAWTANLRAATAALLGAASAAEKDATANAASARASLEEAARRLAAQAVQDELVSVPSSSSGPSSSSVPSSSSGLDAADPAAIESACAQAAESARHRHRDAARAARRFADSHDAIVALLDLQKKTRERHLALQDLRKAFLPGGFPKWLTLRRSRTLLLHASRVLGEITRGRYAFEEPDDREEWRIVDQESGEPRSPASLSGGEQFVASLSLALGMVEAMARSGGRLESLFLDEGFGALDRYNLDAAVEALGAVAARGRMVGVISHVRAVSEQIENVLEVVRRPTGSEARWLSPAERGQMSRTEAAQTASEAMEGLLE